MVTPMCLFSVEIIGILMVNVFSTLSPCPEGEEKCGAFDGYAGYCTAPELCCADDEELCYSDDWYSQAEYCAPISTGGW